MPDKKIKVALSMSTIVENILTMAGGQPYRHGTAMFVGDEREGVRWLSKPQDLFGFLGTETGQPARFIESTGFHTKAEVFSELQHAAKPFDSIELHPHFPPFSNHYYACKWPDLGDGQTIARLLDRFNPETQADRHLIHSLMTTLVWGGLPGTRPMFVITADCGRGAGKSTLARMAAVLVGGALSLAKNEEIERLKGRMLSPTGLRHRVVILDNVKSNLFSNADIEALITSPTVSGHRLYCGEAQRPNALTYVITVNSPSIAEDFSQRSVTIKLGKPTYTASWLEETEQFIDRYRSELIGDLRSLIESESPGLTQFSRWQSWERDILSKLPDADSLQKVILDRQREFNADREDSSIIEDHFRERLIGFGYDPDVERVFLPSEIAVRWLGDATGQHRSTRIGGRELNQKISEGMLTLIHKCPSRAHGRGFLWVGTRADINSPLRTDMASRAIQHDFGYIQPLERTPTDDGSP